MNEYKLKDFTTALINALLNLQQLPGGRELLEAKKEELRQRGVLEMEVT